jgi:hypothetical protein
MSRLTKNYNLVLSVFTVKAWVRVGGSSLPPRDRYFVSVIAFTAVLIFEQIFGIQTVDLGNYHIRRLLDFFFSFFWPRRKFFRFGFFWKFLGDFKNIRSAYLSSKDRVILRARRTRFKKRKSVLGFLKFRKFISMPGRQSCNVLLPFSRGSKPSLVRARRRLNVLFLRFLRLFRRPTWRRGKRSRVKKFAVWELLRQQYQRIGWFRLKLKKFRRLVKVRGRIGAIFVRKYGIGKEKVMKNVRRSSRFLLSPTRKSRFKVKGGRMQGDYVRCFLNLLVAGSFFHGKRRAKPVSSLRRTWVGKRLFLSQGRLRLKKKRKYRFGIHLASERRNFYITFFNIYFGRVILTASLGNVGILGRRTRYNFQVLVPLFHQVVRFIKFFIYSYYRKKKLASRRLFEKLKKRLSKNGVKRKGQFDVLRFLKYFYRKLILRKLYLYIFFNWFGSRAKKHLIQSEFLKHFSRFCPKHDAKEKQLFYSSRLRHYEMYKLRKHRRIKEFMRRKENRFLYKYGFFRRWKFVKKHSRRDKASWGRYVGFMRINTPFIHRRNPRKLGFLLKWYCGGLRKNFHKFGLRWLQSYARKRKLWNSFFSVSRRLVFSKKFSELRFIQWRPRGKKVQFRARA